jgi:hypothetical protein
VDWTQHYLFGAAFYPHKKMWISARGGVTQIDNQKTEGDETHARELLTSRDVQKVLNTVEGPTTMRNVLPFLPTAAG